MNIFIDTADIAEIREACSWGIVDGLTTNPSLIRKAVDARKQDRIDMESYIEEICSTVDGPVSLEVISLSVDAMIEEAVKLHRRFYPIRSNVVIKIPVNTSDEPGASPGFEGLKAIRTLAERGIDVNATLIMTVEQALLCAKAGARYVSPFLGRVDDYQTSLATFPLPEGETSPTAGCQLVEQIAHVFRQYSLDCSIIAASIRNVTHVRCAEMAGADIATIPFAVLKEMTAHPKTSEGVRRFADDVVPEYSQLFDSLTVS